MPAGRTRHRSARRTHERRERPDQGAGAVHVEQNLHRQAGLDSSIAVVELATALAGGRGLPGHYGIKPDRQRTTALERFVIGRPDPDLVGGEDGSAHARQLSHWIH